MHTKLAELATCSFVILPTFAAGWPKGELKWTNSNYIADHVCFA